MDQRRCSQKFGSLDSDLQKLRAQEPQNHLIRYRSSGYRSKSRYPLFNSVPSPSSRSFCVPHDTADFLWQETHAKNFCSYWWKNRASLLIRNPIILAFRIFQDQFIRDSISPALITKSLSCHILWDKIYMLKSKLFSLVSIYSSYFVARSGHFSLLT